MFTNFSSNNTVRNEFLVHFAKAKDSINALCDNNQRKELSKEVSELESKLSGTCEEDIWSNPKSAAKLSQHFHTKKAKLDELDRLYNMLNEANELHELAISTSNSDKDDTDDTDDTDDKDDKDSLNDIKRECYDLLNQVEYGVKVQRLRSALDNPNDNSDCDCFMTILAGAGGDDAKQWVSMLAKSYIGWARRRGSEIRTLDGGTSEVLEAHTRAATSNSSSTFSDNSGTSAITLHITGGNCPDIPGLSIGSSYLYGYLRAEAGVHRLVRLSPFNGGKRQTSFAQVLVYPDVPLDDNNNNNDSDGDGELLNMNDVKVQTYRSSGAGGQSVNTTDSAVRLIHEPTGIVVTCQNERSQHQNKAIAIKLLRAKLLLLKKEELDKKLRSLAFAGTGTDTGTGGGDDNKDSNLSPSSSSMNRKDSSFGSSGQVRSYVLHPYQMFKDSRSGYQSSNINELLEGGPVLDEAMEAALQAMAVKE